MADGQQLMVPRRPTLAGVAVQSLLGLSVGAGITAVISAQVIGWMATPAYGQMAISCAPDIQRALGDLMRYMLIGGAVSAVITPLFMYLIFYRGRAVPARSAPTGGGTQA